METKLYYLLWVVLLKWIALDLTDVIKSVNKYNELVSPYELLTCLSP